MDRLSNSAVLGHSLEPLSAASAFVPGFVEYDTINLVAPQLSQTGATDSSQNGARFCQGGPLDSANPYAPDL